MGGGGLCFPYHHPFSLFFLVLPFLLYIWSQLYDSIVIFYVHIQTTYFSSLSPLLTSLPHLIPFFLFLLFITYFSTLILFHSSPSPPSHSIFSSALSCFHNLYRHVYQNHHHHHLSNITTNCAPIASKHPPSESSYPQFLVVVCVYFYYFIRCLGLPQSRFT